MAHRENWLVYDTITGRQIEKSGGNYQGSFEDRALVILEPIAIIPIDADYVGNQGEPITNLEILRKGIWEAVKRKRAKVENGGAIIPGIDKIIQTDEKSKSKLLGLALMAQIKGSSFSQKLTLADNSKLTVDAQKMIEIAVVAGEYVSNAHARSDELRDTINEATSVEQLLTIPIFENWPK